MTTLAYQQDKIEIPYACIFPLGNRGIHEPIGFSEDVKFVIRQEEAAEIHYRVPISRNLTEQLFICLSKQWSNDTLFLSNITEIVSHPAYQRIISLGSEVLPYIFKDLERSPKQWFFALKKITGENPVTPDQRGRFREMANSWLRWGRANGYRW